MQRIHLSYIRPILWIFFNIYGSWVLPFNILIREAAMNIAVYFYSKGISQRLGNFRHNQVSIFAFRIYSKRYSDIHGRDKNNNKNYIF